MMEAIRPVIIGVIGLKKSGKTTTIEGLIRAAKSRGLKVAGIKYMPNHDEYLDTEGKDTYRHAEAGADIVIGLSKVEVSSFSRVDGRSTLEDAFPLIPAETDLAICEGIPADTPEARFVMALGSRDMYSETLAVRGLSVDRLVSISGRVSSQSLSDIEGTPVLNCMTLEGAGKVLDMVLGT